MTSPLKTCPVCEGKAIEGRFIPVGEGTAGRLTIFCFACASKANTATMVTCHVDNDNGTQAAAITRAVWQGMRRKEGAF